MLRMPSRVVLPFGYRISVRQLSDTDMDRRDPDSKLIWKGVPAGALTVVCSYLIPDALMTTAPVADEAAGVPDGAGAPEAGAPEAALGAGPPEPGVPDAPALAAALGAGVTAGAGAYVQPGAAALHAASAARERTASDKRRR